MHLEIQSMNIVDIPALLICWNPFSFHLFSDFYV